jgi:hypothetical protein
MMLCLLLLSLPIVAVWAGISEFESAPVDLSQLAGSRSSMYTLADTREHGEICVCVRRSTH